jgi:threonine/homoserine/homoserine lactone efflux protein
MDLAFLARGLAVGFTVAAAVGPISVLTIRRTIAHGRVYGLVSGIGVALADASYAGIAAFGLTAVTSVLVGARVAFGLIGGVFLIWLAIRTIRARPASSAVIADDRPGLPAAFLSIYGLTMTNPMTILSFAGIFAGLGLAGQGGTEAALLTIGVFLGSSLWWILLTAVIGRFRDRVTPRVFRWINWISGVSLLAFGVYAILHALGVDMAIFVALGLG